MRNVKIVIGEKNPGSYNPPVLKTQTFWLWEKHRVVLSWTQDHPSPDLVESCLIKFLRTIESIETKFGSRMPFRAILPMVREQESVHLLASLNAVLEGLRANLFIQDEQLLWPSGIQLNKQSSILPNRSRESASVPLVPSKEVDET